MVSLGETWSKIVQWKLVLLSKCIFELVHRWGNYRRSKIYCTYNNSGKIFAQIVTVVYLHVNLFTTYGKTYSWRGVFRTLSKIFDGSFLPKEILASSYFREKLWKKLYHTCRDIAVLMRLERFLAERSKSTKRLTAVVINNSFRASFLSSIPFTASEYLERKTFRMLQIIPNVVSRGLKNHLDGKIIKLNFCTSPGLLHQRLICCWL